MKRQINREDIVWTGEHIFKGKVEIDNSGSGGDDATTLNGNSGVASFAIYEYDKDLRIRSLGTQDTEYNCIDPISGKLWGIDTGLKTLGYFDNINGNRIIQATNLIP